MLLLRILGQEARRERKETLPQHIRGSHVSIEDQVIDGTSIVKTLPQPPQRHTPRVIKEIVQEHGVHGSQSAGISNRAQPYRLQQANQSDGQWSRWADDIRQSQPDQWSSSSSNWHSSAGDERSWKSMSEWDRSKWSTPTRSTLKGPEYDTDREWHLRNMRYGDGWAYDSTQSHYKRAKPTHTDPEDYRTTDSSLPIGSTSKTHDPRKDGSFWQRKDMVTLFPPRLDSGDQG